MRYRKITSTLMVLFLIATLVAGCAQNEQAKPTDNTQTKAADTLKIGSLTIEENLPVLVAQQNGYFAAENLQVELVPFQSPVELQSTFQTGQLDGMITDLLIGALLKGSGQDLRVTSIALGATPQEGRFAIVASPKSDIKSVQDLKGKSIGISTNSIIEYVTDGLLEDGGVNPSEVKKTTVAKIPVRLEMLLNNQIDAITVPDPQISYTVAQGARIIAEDTTGENLSQSVTLMTAKALETKKDAISRFFKAYAKAVEDINKAPDQYKDLLVKNVNIPENIVESYKVQHYSAPQLPAEKDVNEVIDWLNDKKLLKNEVNYQNLIQKDLY